MKTAILILGTALAVGTVRPARGQQYQNQVETGVYLLRPPGSYRPGWLFQQQFSRLLTPGFGMALGFGVGTSAYLPPDLADPYEVARMYERHYGMVDLSAFGIPLRRGPHRLRLLAGPSLVVSKEMRVDSLLGEPFVNQATFKFEKWRRLGFHAGAAYEFALSPRWTVGVNAAAYFLGSAPTWIAGLKGTYHFQITEAALGMRKPDWSRFQYGVRGGWGINNLVNFGTKSRGDFHAGVYTETGVGRNWLLRGEVVYSQKGARISVPVSPSRTLLLRARFQYLDLPLLFKHQLIEKLYLYGGIQLAVLLKQSVEYNGATGTFEGVSPVEGGLVGGVAYHFAERWQAELRHNQGIITIGNNWAAVSRVSQVSVSHRIR